MKDAPENSKAGRRSFLKGTAAAAGAAIAATTKLAQAAEPAADKPAAAKPAAREEAAERDLHHATRARTSWRTC